MFTLPADRTGPRWAGNQLAQYVRKLAKECETQARELGYEALARPLGCYDPGHEDVFEEALQATVNGFPRLLEREDETFSRSHGPEQFERLATNSPGIMDRGDTFVFSAAPTAGQYVAWQKFKGSLQDHYQPRILSVFQQGLPGF